MATLQDLADRAAIQDLLIAEASAMDRGDWETWEALFLPEAWIDYSANDGATGHPAAVRAWLCTVLGAFEACTHLSSNHEIRLDGDTATARSLQYIGVKRREGEGSRVLFSGIWFRDRLQRTPIGWRIAERVEELAWRHNFPQDFLPPPLTK